MSKDQQDMKADLLVSRVTNKRNCEKKIFFVRIWRFMRELEELGMWKN